MRQDLFPTHDVMTARDWIVHTSKYIPVQRKFIDRMVKTKRTKDADQRIEGLHTEMAKEHFSLFRQILQASKEIQRMLKSHNVTFPEFQDDEEGTDWFDESVGASQNFYSFSYFASFDAMRKLGYNLEVLKDLVDKRVIKPGLEKGKGKKVVELIDSWDETLGAYAAFNEEAIPDFS